MSINFSDFFFEVAKGNVAGHSVKHVAGHNEDFQAAEDVWDYGGDYTDSVAAVVHHISSSSGSDTEVILVTYLDENWDEQTIEVTLAGQAETVIGTGETMIRIQQAESIGANALVGDVYIYEDDTVSAGVPQTATKVRGKISIGHGAELNAKYAIPSGKTGFLVARTLSASISGDVDISLLTREFGRSYIINTHPHLSIDSMSGPIGLHAGFPEKTDIKYRASSSAGNSVLGVDFTLILVDNAYLLNT